MAEALVLLAAGSLSGALGGIGPVAGRPVRADFGPSGLLRARIEGGAAWDVFASADTGHPARLQAAGLGTAPRVFCSNRLALILRPGLSLNLDGAEAAALLRRPDLRLGISTPGNDPSGDYALDALDRLDPGLAARALRLTGAPDLPRPPEGRNPYAWLVASGAADLFLTYRTNARVACADTPGLSALDLPEALQPRAEYALTARTGADTGPAALAEYLLSAPVQARLAALGFEPAQPRPKGDPA